MQVEIWSDVVCPWCYIGKRRFEAALSAFPHADEVEVTWRSFQLDPTVPIGSEMPTAEMLARKYGMDPERVQQMQDQVTATAAEEGLEYHLDRTVSVNTFDAHRLLHLARQHGVQAPLEEELFRAYFTQGRILTDADTLVELASGVGLDESSVRALLASDQFADAVRADQTVARDLGITAVPTFVFDRTSGISGAQPAAGLLDALEQAYASSAAEVNPRGRG